MNWRAFVQNNAHNELCKYQESLRQKNFQPVCARTHYKGTSKTIMGLIE